MNKDRFEYLYERYLSGQLSVQEHEEWSAQFADPEFEKELTLLVSKLWEREDLHVPPANAIQKEKIFRDILIQIPPQYTQTNINIPAHKQTKKLWPRIGIAAAVATMIISVGIYLIKPTQQSNTLTQTVEQDIAPGRQGATLTLANGEKIRLTEAKQGELAQQSGVVISKAADGQLVYEMKSSAQNADQINTLSTTNGETYRLRLPDGSLVWLNSASSLTYTASLLERGKRVVKLTGEGYFEVAKDKVHPFVVETARQQVEVLGTQFNVNAYEDEPSVATTLLEGSVRLKAGNAEKILKPGEQGVNAGNEIKVLAANLDNILDWKEGDFYLNNLDFKTAMRKIERWYDVEFIYDDSVPDDLATGGWISRDKKLSNVLKFIESTGLVHFRIEGRKVYVTK